jgi:hypothetical protein
VDKKSAPIIADMNAEFRVGHQPAARKGCPPARVSDHANPETSVFPALTVKSRKIFSAI